LEKTLKKYSVAVLLYFSVLPLFAQNSYEINDFGTYIITNGIIQKVPVDYKEMELDFVCFREEYAVFLDAMMNTYIVYNCGRKIVSEPLERPHIQLSTERGLIGLQKNKNQVFVYLEGIMYILDTTTLFIVESYCLEECDFANVFFFYPECKLFLYVKINVNTVRYFFSGGYKQFQRKDKPKISGFKSEINEDNPFPFVDNYKYIDLHYSSYLWESPRAGYKYYYFHLGKEDINFVSELHGERLIITVYLHNYWLE
jgi:(2Fe-2S) ferredoxin